MVLEFQFLVGRFFQVFIKTEDAVRSSTSGRTQFNIVDQEFQLQLLHFTFLWKKERQFDFL